MLMCMPPEIFVDRNGTLEKYDSLPPLWKFKIRWILAVVDLDFDKDKLLQYPVGVSEMSKIVFNTSKNLLYVWFNSVERMEKHFFCFRTLNFAKEQFPKTKMSNSRCAYQKNLQDQCSVSYRQEFAWSIGYLWKTRLESILINRFELKFQKVSFENKYLLLFFIWWWK